jgi:hypothetical protein
MTAPPLAKRTPDPQCSGFLTGNGTARFESTNQQATAPAKPSLDRHPERVIVPQTLPARAQQRLEPRRPRSAILIAAVKSP